MSSSTPCAWPRAAAAKRRRTPKGVIRRRTAQICRRTTVQPTARRLSVRCQDAEGALVGNRGLQDGAPLPTTRPDPRVRGLTRTERSLTCHMYFDPEGCAPDVTALLAAPPSSWCPPPRRPRAGNADDEGLPGLRRLQRLQPRAQWRLRGRQRRMVLSGASVEGRSESYKVHGTGDSKSLTRSPRRAPRSRLAVCVDVTRPTFRFFAKRTSGTWATSPSSCAGTTAAGTRTDRRRHHRDRHVVGGLTGDEPLDRAAPLEPRPDRERAARVRPRELRRLLGHRRRLRRSLRPRMTDGREPMVDGPGARRSSRGRTRARRSRVWSMFQRELEKFGCGGRPRRAPVATVRATVSLICPLLSFQRSLTARLPHVPLVRFAKKRKVGQGDVDAHDRRDRSAGRIDGQGTWRRCRRALSRTRCPAFTRCAAQRPSIGAGLEAAIGHQAVVVGVAEGLEGLGGCVVGHAACAAAGTTRIATALSTAVSRG